MPRHTLPEPSLSRCTSSATHCPFTPFRSTTGKDLIGTDFTDGPVVVVTTTVDTELQPFTTSRHTNADANATRSAADHGAIDSAMRTAAASGMSASSRIVTPLSTHSSVLPATWPGTSTTPLSWLMKKT